MSDQKPIARARGRGRARPPTTEQQTRRPGPVTQPPLVQPPPSAGRGARAPPLGVGAQPPPPIGGRARGTTTLPSAPHLEAAAAAATAPPPTATVASNLGLGRASHRGGVRGEARPGDVAQQMGQLSLSEGPRSSRNVHWGLEPPVPQIRSDDSKRGECVGETRRTRLITNYFKLTSRTNDLVQDYRVDFEPDIESKSARCYLMRASRATLGNNFLFDGMNNLRMLKKLPDEVTYIEANSDRHGPVRITLKHTREMAPDDPQLCHLFNSQMKRNLENLGYRQIGRNYFNPSEERRIQSKYNISIWPGLVTPIGEFEAGILMTVQTVNKFLRNDTVLDKLNEMKQRNPRAGLGDLKKELLGSVVLTKYNNKTYTILDFDEQSSPMQTFERKGQQISFIDYYTTHYNIQITNRDQPLIIAESREREARDDRVEKKRVKLIPELCTLTGLTDNQRSDFLFMQEVAKTTRLNPAMRYNYLVDFMRKMASNPKVNQEMTSWNLSFEKEPLTVDARELPPEEIKFKDTSVVTDQNADFTRALRNPLCDAKGIQNWIMVFPRSIKNSAQNLKRELSFVSRGMDFFLSEPNPIELNDDRNMAYIQAFNHYGKNVDFILAIVTSNKADRYNMIKQTLCKELAVPSQVVVSRTIDKAKNLKSVATKIALQMSCKVGGIPWMLKIPLKTLMVIGYDTYHEKKSKSVGAFVSSLNPTCTNWYSQARIHGYQGAQEISTAIEQQTLVALRQYLQVNGNPPSTIAYYRDGVSEGQINYVNSTEVEGVKRAWRALFGEQELKLIFIVVNKRINTRFFKQQNNELRNPFPGTVVDSQVTHKRRYDFYLVSQSVRQGTVGPTSYYIIEDTTTLKPDHVQRLSYKLTHLYYNWPGTIRVPAPCQYAHKLAFLVGQSLHGEFDSRLSDKLFYL